MKMKKTTSEEARKQWDEQLEVVISYAANGKASPDWRWELDMARAALSENHPPKASSHYGRAAAGVGVGDETQFHATEELGGLHPTCLTILREWTTRMPTTPGDHPPHVLLAEVMEALLPLYEQLARDSRLILRVKEFKEALSKKRAEVRDPRLNPLVSTTYTDLRKLASEMDDGFTRVRDSGWLLPDELHP